MQKLAIMDKETIIAFHIGRGGQHFNPGWLSYIGQKEIGKTPDFSTLIEVDGEYLKENGNSADITTEEVESGIGRIDIDGHYDTTYTKKLEDATENELVAIARSDQFDKEDTLQAYGFKVVDEAKEANKLVEMAEVGINCTLSDLGIMEITEEEYLEPENPENDQFQILGKGYYEVMRD